MKVGILVGSIRKTRVTDRLAKWIESELKKVEGVEVFYIDLIEYSMPLFDSPISPSSGEYQVTDENAKKYLKVIGELDSLVVVTPEYNRSYSSAVKNALDYIGFELKRKPVMLAAHGSTGGAQAVAHLRGVLPGLISVTSPAAMMVVGQLGQIFDENGVLNQSAPQAQYIPASLQRAIEEFIWLTKALNEARAKESN